jgi:hypothetical protein
MTNSLLAGKKAPLKVVFNQADISTPKCDTLRLSATGAFYQPAANANNGTAKTLHAAFQNQMAAQQEKTNGTSCQICESVNLYI